MSCKISTWSQIGFCFWYLLNAVSRNSLLTWPEFPWSTRIFFFNIPQGQQSDMDCAFLFPFHCATSRKGVALLGVCTAGRPAYIYVYCSMVSRGSTSPFSIPGSCSLFSPEGSCSPFSTGDHVLPTLISGGDVAPTVSLHCFLFVLQITLCCWNNPWIFDAMTL